MKSSILLALACAGLVAVPAAAAAADDQARDLCADRPGKATPPCILDVGHWQVEVGLADASWTRGSGARDDVYALGGFELRRGVTRSSEVEIAWTPWSIERASDAGGRSRLSGVGDLQLSFRQALTDPDGKGLSVSLEPFVTAPTATDHQGAGGWEGGVLLPVAGQLSDKISFGLTPEVDVVRDEGGGGTHLAWSGAAGLSRGFGPATLGVEIWGQRDDDPARATTEASFDLTAAYVPAKTPDVQLDAGLNAGLNHNTPDLEAYVGVTRRF